MESANAQRRGAASSALEREPRHVESIAALADLAEKENRLEDRACPGGPRARARPEFLRGAGRDGAASRIRAGDADAAEATARRPARAAWACGPISGRPRTCCWARRSRSSAAMRRPSRRSPEANEMDRKLQAPRVRERPVREFTGRDREADPLHANGRFLDEHGRGRQRMACRHLAFLVGFPRAGTTLLAASAGGATRSRRSRSRTTLATLMNHCCSRPVRLSAGFPAARRNSASGGAEYWNRVERRMPAEPRNARPTSTSCR